MSSSNSGNPGEKPEENPAAPISQPDKPPISTVSSASSVVTLAPETVVVSVPTMVTGITKLDNPNPQRTVITSSTATTTMNQTEQQIVMTSGAASTGSALSFTGNANNPNVVTHQQHIRIPTVPTAIQRTSISSSNPANVAVSVHNKPATITLARPAAVATLATHPSTTTTFITTGHHRLPMAPIISSISNSPSAMMAKVNVPKTSPISLAVIQHPQPDAIKSGALEISSKNVISNATSIRPLTLATGFPVTIGSQGAKPTVVSNNPIQLVPLSSASGPIRVGAGQATIRQVTPGKTTVRAPHVTTEYPPPPVRVTMVQTPMASISKVSTSQAAGFYEPVTIASQVARQIRPQTQIGGLAQPLRITSPAGPRMTVVSHQGQAHSINVALSPSHIQIPAHQQQQQHHQQQQPMAGVLTSGGGGTTTRFISMPTSPASGGVTIQKALVSTTMPQGGAKAISLPHSMSATSTVPKVVVTSSNIPVARVIPRLSNNPGDTNLYITRNLLQPMHYSSQHEEGGGPPLLVTSMPIGGVASGSGLQQQHQRSPMKYNPGTGSFVEAGMGPSGVSVPMSPSRPGILRRREGEREPLLDVPSRPPRPESQDDGGSSSGSTTLSATSSPCDAQNLSGDELPHQIMQPSPRKKPRKQQYSNVREHSWSEIEEPTNLKRSPVERKYSIPLTAEVKEEPEELKVNIKQEEPINYYAKNRPPITLVGSYRHTWKSRHNHFLRYSDVKEKEERRPTVNELANQTNMIQKINGWKIYHLSSQIEDITDIEVEFNKKLNVLLKKLDKFGHKDLHKDIVAVQEIIKANLQRSKLVQDQVTDAKQHSIDIFEHKQRVLDIMARYSSNKRHAKKREFKM